MDIKLIGVNKSFGEKQVLKNINMTFFAGRISCIMGASGSGKTTLVNILMGLIKPDGGMVEGLEGRKIAAVFQEDRLIEHWDALKNVQLVCNKTIQKQDIRNHFTNVDLMECEEKAVSTLSGGMRRRVAIVRALVADSNLIIMDEPFKGLDEALKQQIVRYVKEQTKGKTVLIITHDREDVRLLEADLFRMTSI